MTLSDFLYSQESIKPKCGCIEYNERWLKCKSIIPSNTVFIVSPTDTLILLKMYSDDGVIEYIDKNKIILGDNITLGRKILTNTSVINNGNANCIITYLKKIITP